MFTTSLMLMLIFLVLGTFAYTPVHIDNTYFGGRKSMSG
jgi:hypothetical protein